MKPVEELDVVKKFQRKNNELQQGELALVQSGIGRAVEEMDFQVGFKTSSRENHLR